MHKVTRNPKIQEIDVKRPNEDLISHLEKLLEYAKTGELIGICEVCRWQGNNVSSGWYIRDGDYIRTIIGQLELLKIELFDSFYGKDET